MKRKDTPAHNRWYKRIEGQIRDCIYAHPEFFTVDLKLQETLLNSLSKRIVGEIVADEKARTHSSTG